MRSSFVGACLVAVLSVPAWCTGQDGLGRSGVIPPTATPPAPAEVPPAQSMVATDRFLFVIRGAVLYQFDTKSLKLLHTFTFPDGKAPTAGDLAQQVAAPEINIEEPPPPPSAWPMAAETAAASIAAGLQWLAAHQDEDGRWDADGFMKHDQAGAPPSDGPGNAVHDVGVTGLALLAMLGGGNTMRSGPHKDPVKRAVAWLRDQQQNNGLIGTNASHDFIYDHAIATYAICEAYGLSNYNALKPIAQKGLNYLESHRNPYAVWRYQPRDNDNDTSVTTWALAANVSGKSFGLEVNAAALQTTGVWYDQVTSPDGRAGYTKRGEPSSRMPGDHSQRFPVGLGEAMTAAALYGRFFLGQDPKQKPIMKAAADRLAEQLPQWQPDRIDSVYWYFGTYAMFQMGGDHWDAWNGALSTLVEHQRQDGNSAGSWDPLGVWDQAGGRVFVTALNTLSLQASHRFAKLVR